MTSVIKPIRAKIVEQITDNTTLTRVYDGEVGQAKSPFAEVFFGGGPYRFDISFTLDRDVDILIQVTATTDDECDELLESIHALWLGPGNTLMAELTALDVVDMIPAGSGLPIPVEGGKAFFGAITYTATVRYNYSV